MAEDLSMDEDRPKCSKVPARIKTASLVGQKSGREQGTKYARPNFIHTSRSIGLLYQSANCRTIADRLRCDQIEVLMEAFSLD